jgi:hypothetical protein
MCYQLPGAITFSGRPITGGVDINQNDYDFAARIYPLPAPPAELASALAFAEDDWPESEDNLALV